MDNGQTIVVTPMAPEAKYIRVSVGSELQLRHYMFLTPGQAYLFGKELEEHARECGFEPE